MTPCLRYAPMIGAREGELAAEQQAALSDHLATCELCQARLADERALEGLLEEALLREAARRDFSTFVDGVMERVEPRAVRPSRWRRWRWALGSALVPTLAAVGLIVYLHVQGPGFQVGDVEVTSELYVPVVLQTDDGPLVVLGDEDPQKS